MDKLNSIISHFNITGDIVEIKPLGNGLINDTYRVITAGEAPDYVLQRINHLVFKDVETMQHNIESVTDHLRAKLENENATDIDRKVLWFAKEKETGKTYWTDGETYWRVSRFIPDNMTLEAVTPDTSRAAGIAFGDFQTKLADINAELEESIPGFHNMEGRLQQLKTAVEADAKGRVAEVKDILDEIYKRADKMCEPEKLHREGKLPKRICHCDTKVNNVLFDKEGNVLCVIDLDTVMPSYIYSDYGDFLRTGACTTPEDEPDVDKIDFNMDIFKAFTEGYLSKASAFLTKEELDWLPMSVALFPYMQAVRFLADYINGDTYFKIAYPEHNLVRTKAQMRLLEKIEEKLPQIKEVIETCTKN